tara:strand:- start:3068 stop:3598 length:531 start_codon:yes stop_codon:yes gene_type:complete
MVDSVKNYGIAGVSANVQLGKGGVKVVGSNSDQVSFVNTSDALVNVNLANGSAATHAVTKAQLDLIEAPKLQYIDTTVSYDSGTTAIGTTDSNTIIHMVVVEKDASWTNANNTTEITVGDGSDNDRLFAGFDPTIQVKFETKHKYESATALSIFVTQGGASAGTAVVRVWYSGNIE